MSSFALVSVEKDYKIDISEGKATLGRGPFLQITDKRVSRNHATLEVSGTAMTILPTHSNPTFYQACGGTKFEPLEKDQLKELQSGDCISFLPNDLVFRVEKQEDSAITEDSTARVSGAGDNNVENNKEIVKENNPGMNGDEADDSEKDNIEKKDDKKNDNEVYSDVEDGDEADEENDEDKTETEKPAHPLNKTRILPSWMTKNKGNEANTNPKKGKTTKKNAKKVDATEEAIEEDLVESPVKVRGSLEEKEKETFSGRGDDDADEKDEKQASNEREEQESRKSPTVEEEDKKRKRVDENEDVEQSRKREKKLPRCPFGVDCYRKNPVHFEEYSHDSPSDDDGENDDKSGDEKSKDDELGDDLPECPYGEDCYRKNPRHRRQYKHTPQPKTRERRAKRKAFSKIRDDDDGPNDYDFEDSFIDDESESSAEPSDNEDSDWQPPDDEQDDDADVSELLTEARDFTQNKKMLKPT